MKNKSLKPDALASIAQELGKPAPDIAKIKVLLVQVIPGTLRGAMFDQIAALFALELASHQPELFPTNNQ